jgi:predicted Zn-dependent peptidase
MQRFLAASRRILALCMPVLCSAAIFAATLPAAQDSTAPYRASLEKRVTVTKLANGLTLILCRRPEAPVFSYFTLVDAGDANDPGGQSGLAHMFEHLAFKGTEDIGTKDYPAEKAALAKVEEAWHAYDNELRKRVGQDPQKLAALKAQFDAAEKAANDFVIPNEFTEIAEANGATGLNAETSLDATQYYWSMPENRLELWAYLESDRIGHPVPRQFYRERNVVEEERRMRVDSQPTGRLVEQFLATAYAEHPYRRPNVGWESELTQLSATDAEAFHRRYYVPANITVAVVGDIDAGSALPMLEKYFGAIPAGPKPEPMSSVEPPQTAEKQLILHEASQPLYLEGYHRPDYLDPDDAVYDAIQDIFSNGRTSRLYRSLVRDQRIAAQAEGFSGFPGDKYPGLFAFFAVPNPGHTPAEMRTAIHKEIEKLKNTDVTDAELEMFRTRARADVLRSLGDNQGLAQQLAIDQLRYGDWRELFRQLDKIDAVTKADIRRVAQKTFVDTNRTWAAVETEAPAATQQEPAR